MKPNPEGCAVCGKGEYEHDYNPKSIRTNHTIFKYSKLETARYCRRKNGRFKCKQYDGFCIEDNKCHALKNVRGGDFGWGECIYNAETKMPKKAEGE